MGLITENLPMPQPVKFIMNWGRRYSLWVMNFGLACCAIEFIAASTSKHDFIRFGVIPFAHGPRQAVRGPKRRFVMPPPRGTRESDRRGDRGAGSRVRSRPDVAGALRSPKLESAVRSLRVVVTDIA